ncbi:hypothetical protein Pflav_057220 [Phytohabitans flavus]|uniref:Uncharacterized protein n=1 Tax=Phytohabitans flavus TaxID=1076124 RepID=A0A6F8XZM3_9ACTN|nr:hypothetical protein Pflav_057220 [Phytohabitans flavus]
MAGTHVDQALDLGLLVGRTEVDVQPVLAGLGVCHGYEDQTGELVGCAANLHLVGPLIGDLVTERLGPPAREARWIKRIDDQILPAAAHWYASRFPSCRQAASYRQTAPK